MDRIVDKVTQHQAKRDKATGKPVVRKGARPLNRTKRREKPRGRLPDKAVFELRYDASQTLWIGKLTVEDRAFHFEKRVFEADRGSVERLILRGLYDKWEAARDAAEKKIDAEEKKG